MNPHVGNSGRLPKGTRLYKTRKVEMNRLRRLVAGATLVVTMAATVGFASPTHAAATTLGTCVVSGSMTISPGLSTGPEPTSMSFTGNASPCLGVAAGSISGGASCTLDSLAACATGNGFVTASPLGSCSGAIWFHVGLYYEMHCLTPFGAFWMYWLAVPNPAVQNPGTTVNFD